jgi:hypothetical protein
LNVPSLLPSRTETALPSLCFWAAFAMAGSRLPSPFADQVEIAVMVDVRRGQAKILTRSMDGRALERTVALI